MRSFLSRLASPRRASIAEAPTAEVRRIRDEDLRIGVDFGTSTTQVAVRIGSGEPRLIRLSPETEHLPSYMALDGQGRQLFGLDAMNTFPNVHSVKAKLVADQPLPEADGLRPSDVAHAFLSEVVRRTLTRLQDERLLPADVDRLLLSTNLGCTPRFDLTARARLRDVAKAAGLNVRLADLIEEPVSAAFEVTFSGLVDEGVRPDGARLLLVDIGGGTLDVAVMKVGRALDKTELYATRGWEDAGDRFTELIVGQVTKEVKQLAGADVALTNADRSLMWARAEAAKTTLSFRSSTVIALGGIAGIGDETFELTSDALRHLAGNLLARIRTDVRVAYMLARLILDRGGPEDPAPGTVDYLDAGGGVRSLVDMDVSSDAREHLDAVVLVGGASQMPMIRAVFERQFAGLLRDPQFVGLDPVQAVVLGLARQHRLSASNLRYPNWGVSAIFKVPGGPDLSVPLYEPFAPSFDVKNGFTSVYRRDATTPPGATHVAIAFREAGTDRTQMWPPVPLPDSSATLSLGLDLFGRVSMSADGRPLYVDGSSQPTPWQTAEAYALPSWVPPGRKTDWYKDLPQWDWRNM